MRRRERYGDLLLTEEGWAQFGERHELSPRELSYVHGTMNLETEKEVAAGLGISRHTLHVYAKRAFIKLGVSSREQLAVFVGAYCFHDAEPAHLGIKRQPSRPAPLYREFFSGVTSEPGRRMAPANGLP